MDIKTKIVHRRYPENEWDYQAISTMLENGTVNVLYYTVEDKGEFRVGFEVYKGANYIVGSKERSYSRSYTLKNIPVKYKKLAVELCKIHNKTKWSEAKRVDIN